MTSKSTNSVGLGHWFNHCGLSLLASTPNSIRKGEQVDPTEKLGKLTEWSFIVFKQCHNKMGSNTVTTYQRPYISKTDLALVHHTSHEVPKVSKLKSFRDLFDRLICQSHQLLPSPEELLLLLWPMLWPLAWEVPKWGKGLMPAKTHTLWLKREQTHRKL